MQERYLEEVKVWCIAWRDKPASLEQANSCHLQTQDAVNHVCRGFHSCVASREGEPNVTSATRSALSMLLTSLVSSVLGVKLPDVEALLSDSRGLPCELGSDSRLVEPKLGSV